MDEEMSRPNHFLFEAARINQCQNESSVAAADNAANLLRFGRSFPAVPHFKRSANEA